MVKCYKFYLKMVDLWNGLGCNIWKWGLVVKKNSMGFLSSEVNEVVIFCENDIFGFLLVGWNLFLLKKNNKYVF